MARNPVTWMGVPTFPKAAHEALGNSQLRSNLRHAIRDKRAAAVGEVPDGNKLSPAVSTSAPVLSTHHILSLSMALEVSAFLIANVPPNPQHDSAAGSSTRSMPRTAFSSVSGRSPTPSIRNE